MSLNSSLQTLGQLMATNLQSKGVTANASDGLTTLANKILQVGPTPIGYNLELTSDKNILSFYNHEYCVLTATLLDSNGNGVSGEEIVFKANGGLLNTVITGDNGVATVSYNSQGVGDVTITAECMNLTETYSIEDCSYYNTNEVSRTTTNGSTIYDNNLSMSLSLNCEISYEIWSDNGNPTGEHRYFILPLSQYNSGTTQPQNALYFDQMGGNNGNFGKRENNSTVSLLNGFSCTGSTYHIIKYVKNGTSVKMYVDDELKVTASISWIDNYSDYSLSMMRWSSKGTSKIRNVKFKPLQ